MTTQKLKNGMTMTPKRLLIIGNGFDLHLKLKSSFTDFFENKYSDLEKVVKEKKRLISTTYNIRETNSIFAISKLPIFNIDDYYVQDVIKQFLKPFRETHTNFWIKYLLIRKYIFSDKIEEWNDIESTIYDFFDNDNNSLLNIIYIILESLCLKNNTVNVEDSEKIQYIRKSYDLKISDDEFINTLFITLLIIHDMEKDKKAVEKFRSIRDIVKNEYHNNVRSYQTFPFLNSDDQTLDQFNSDIRSKIKDALIIYFRNELTKFESSFNDYMQKQINDYPKTEYKTLSNELLKKLSNGKPYNLLNFNYTNPNTSGTGCLNSNNIHGKLVNPKNFNNSKKSLIIGIDGKNVSINNSEYQFTKTYRTIVSSSNNENNNILSPHIKEICFYGHSFAHADFSYFKNIFQFYRIEKLQTKLILFYSNQPNKTENEIVRNQLLSFSKLIDEYCDDMNLGSGDSLLRRLQVANKIIFKKI